MVVKRDAKFTNFIEVRCSACAAGCRPSATSSAQFRNYKIVYRRYAGLYFSYCLDMNDNELIYLESIHLFVELLDKFFASVCELDLVFNFYK